MVRYVEKYLQCLERLRDDPLCVDALFTLAAIYAVEGHRAQALDYVRKAEFLDAEYPGLLLLKGRILALIPSSTGENGTGAAGS